MFAQKGMGITAVVLAAGQGRRMQSRTQKQFMELAGRPLIVYSLEAFEFSAVEKIILVTDRNAVDFCREEIVKRYGFSKVTAVVEGGKERYHSVYAGLKAAEGSAYVLIHDGARPLVDQPIIEAAISGAVEYEASVIGMPVKDTIKIGDEEAYAVATPDRRLLWQIQTPQAFAYPLIRKAYDKLFAYEENQKNVTDDAMVVEAMTDHKVKLIRGSYANIKVTTPEDLIVAEALIRSRS